MTLNIIFSVVRYEGVIWFIILVLHLLLIRLTSLDLRCISKSMMKHQINKKTKKRKKEKKNEEDEEEEDTKLLLT